MLVPVTEFDCCVNDCILYRNCDSKHYESASSCPICAESRYQPGTRHARKKFKYIPLAPRLRRLFASKKSSKLIQSHAESCNTSHDPDSVILDIHQTPMWMAKYSESGLFKGDPRGISFALCTDGTNPFAKEKVSYSMWPITLTILNFPRNVRNTAASMFLVGIVPGRNEPKHMDPYLEVLVDEIKELNRSEMYDGYKCEKFKLQADISLYILDYPGQGKVFKCHGKCSVCVHCVHTYVMSSMRSYCSYVCNCRYTVLYCVRVKSMYTRSASS